MGLAGSSFCGSHVRRATCERRSDVGVTKMMADGDVTEGGNKPFGMFGQMGKIMDAMKKAQEFTKDAKSLQEELASTVLEATVRNTGSLSYLVLSCNVVLKDILILACYGGGGGMDRHGMDL